MEPAQEVEEQLPAGLGEGQIAELVEDDEVAPAPPAQAGRQPIGVQIRGPCEEKDQRE